MPVENFRLREVHEFAQVTWKVVASGFERRPSRPQGTAMSVNRTPAGSHFASEAVLGPWSTKINPIPEHRLKLGRQVIGRPKVTLKRQERGEVVFHFLCLVNQLLSYSTGGEGPLRGVLKTFSEETGGRWIKERFLKWAHSPGIKGENIRMSISAFFFFLISSL